MTKDEAVSQIEELLKTKKNRVVGKNIVSAALSLFSNPGESVQKLFFGVEDEINNEKHQLEQELILELICKIQEAVTNLETKFSENYEVNKSIIIQGLVEVTAINSENTIGVEIKNNSQQVEFKPGTKISVNSTNSSGNTIGLKIGD